jgi:hypothetical protein
LESYKNYCILKLVLNHMFTKNLRFFGQILHPQWPAQIPKMGPKNGLRPLGVNIKMIQQGNTKVVSK